MMRLSTDQMKMDQGKNHLGLVPGGQRGWKCTNQRRTCSWVWLVWSDLSSTIYSLVMLMPLNLRFPIYKKIKEILFSSKFIEIKWIESYLPHRVVEELS